MKRESRTVDRSNQVDSPTQRHLPVVDLLVDTRAELMELAVNSGLKVLHTMLEEDRTAICGPRYQHQADRTVSRAGTVPSEVVLGGRKVGIRRPRVRRDGAEVPLPTLQLMASEDPLNRRTSNRCSSATRQYARSLEPLPTAMPTRGTSNSTVSLRFVAKTRAQLEAWQSQPLDGFDLVGLILDGVHVGEHCLIVALGIAADGQKHALGLWAGSTENATLDETLTVPALNLPETLRRSLTTTNAAESLISRTRHVKRNVKRWIPIAETFWALRFGKLVDRFGVPWLVNCEKPAVENVA